MEIVYETHLLTYINKNITKTIKHESQARNKRTFLVFVSQVTPNTFLLSGVRFLIFSLNVFILFQRTE